VRVHITLGNYRRASFEHEHFQAVLGQLLRSHPARSTRPDDYRIIDFLPGQLSLLLNTMANRQRQHGGIQIDLLSFYPKEWAKRITADSSNQPYA
jgi:hypothetical protein